VLRRILILGAVVGLLALAALATLPWWWGPVLRMAAARQGVLVGAYSVEGYGRWAIMEVEVSRPDWEVRIGRIEAPHPLLWLWHRRAAAGVVVEDWTVTIHDADADNEPWPTRSEVLAMVEPTLSWLPAVRAGTGGRGDRCSEGCQLCEWPGASRTGGLPAIDRPTGADAER